MKAKDHIVFVVDDDPGMCEALAELLSSLNFHVIVFRSALEYLRAVRPNLPACLILDLQLPDINGLDLQRQLAGRDDPPIVFITGHGDIPSSVRAIKAGAIDFLPKPFAREQLLQAVNEALAQDTKIRVERLEIAQLTRRFSLLTPRERDVLPWLVGGFLNKQAAPELGISEVTFQIHRGQIMRKMAAGSLAELVRMAERLEIPFPSREPASHMKLL